MMNMLDHYEPMYFQIDYLFQHFSRVKIENFGIVGKTKLRTFIWRFLAQHLAEKNRGTRGQSPYRDKSRF